MNTLQEALKLSFEKHAERIALQQGMRERSYRELDALSRQLGIVLGSKGLGPGMQVGLYFGNRIDLVTAISGVLAAGGVFVPIDPALPGERISQILEGTAIRLLICGSQAEADHVSASLEDHPELLVMDAITGTIPDQAVGGGTEEGHDPDSRPIVNISPEDPIYLYFTSGSTGKPKGILGKNKSLLHFLKWEVETFEIQPGARFGQLTTPGFDVFLRDIFTPLIAGGCICIPENRETILDGRSLLRWLEDSAVEYLHIVPSLFRLIREQALDASRLAAMKAILLAGEKLVPASLQAWYRAMGDRIQLVNLYGPTETTLAKLYYLVRPEDADREIMPVGKPIRGARVIILDENQELCDEMVAGELYIRTPFRSLGYFNNPELTAEKFIPNPFSDKPEDLIYRTGDLGRWNAQGEVELLGRADRQLKIRGHRIEPEEIEGVLLGYPGIREAAVQKRVNAQEQEVLVAFISIGPEQQLEQEERAELLTWLSGKLPDYMVPGRIMPLAELPKKVNGKVDLQALEALPLEKKGVVTEARTAEEEQLAGIWKAILGVEEIGIRDSFFESGGNSLNLMELVFKVYEGFGKQLSLEDAAIYNTIERQAALLAAADSNAYDPISQAPEQASYPLSHAQRRLYILEKINPESGHYNVNAALKISGKPDLAQLDRAFNTLIRRHALLRTSFHDGPDGPFQKIHDAIPFQLEIHSPESDDPEALSALLRDCLGPFALDQAPLFRGTWLSTGPEQGILVLAFHHLLVDLIALDLLVDELILLYEGQELEVPALQYKDYAWWQLEKAGESDDMAKQEAFWLNQFRNPPGALKLPTDFPRPSVKQFAGAHYDFNLRAEEAQTLKSMAASLDATLFMTLLSAWVLVLHKLSAETGIVVGTPVSGRTHPDLDRMPGLFINTLALRTFPRNSLSLHDFIREVRSGTLEAFQNQDYPFELLVERLKPERDTSREPLFDVTFAFNESGIPARTVAGLQFEAFPLPQEQVKFDLTLTGTEQDGELYFRLEYSTALFRDETAQLIADCFRMACKRIGSGANPGLLSVDLLSDSRHAALKASFDRTGMAFPADKCLHEWTDESLSLRPESPALVFDGRVMLNKELKSLSDQLGDFLTAHCPGHPGQPVALLLEASAWRVVAMLGALKAGGAFLPLAPGQPDARLQSILALASARILVTQPGLLDRLKEWDRLPEYVVILDDDGQPTLWDEIDGKRVATGPSGPAGKPAPEDLAYIMFTSGSTGKPKGIETPHRAIVNFVDWRIRYYQMKPSDVCLCYFDYTFEPVVEDIFPALISGGQVVLMKEAERNNPARMWELILEHDVSILHFTPSVYQLLLLEKGLAPGKLRALTLGGERIPETMRKLHFDLLPDVDLVNEYGPTETTISSTAFRVGEAGTMYIGQSVSNTRILLLDSNLHTVLPGVPGEIYIGGSGLARGYLNAAGLTAAQFIPDPFNPGARLYRTGDLGRISSGGQLEYLGRIDTQLKLNGVRMERAEIEAALLDTGLVNAHVMAVPDPEGRERLVAYVIAGREGRPDQASLKQHLRQLLPLSMVPESIVVMDRFPVSRTGKTDEAALPVPDFSLQESLDAGEALSGPVQEELAVIWESLLSIRPKGTGAHFFDSGGHSLLATRLASRIYESFGVQLSLMDLFSGPTIGEMARLVEAARTGQPEAEAGIVPRPEGPVPLSFAQQRLWFLEQLGQMGAAYHITLAVSLEGEPDPLLLERALNIVAARHESLRTHFEAVGEGRQVILSEANIPLTVSDLRELPEDRQAQHLSTIEEEVYQRTFDLIQGPLIRIHLVMLGAGQGRLLAALHHIIADAWSMDVLLREFMAAYEALKHKQEPELTPLSIQYGDFSWWQRAYMQGDRLEQELAFWRAQLAGAPGNLELPTDFPRPAEQDYRGASVQFEIPEALADKLRALAKNSAATLYMVLLGGFGLLLSRYSRQKQFLLGSTVANRNRKETEALIGFFTNTLMLHLNLEGVETVGAWLERIRTLCLSIFEHQDLPFERLVEALQPGRDLSRNPLFQVIFDFQNTPQTSLSLGGLDVRPLDTHSGFVKFDITMLIGEQGSGGALSGQLEYKTGLFEAKTIENLIGHYLNLLEGIAGGAAVRLDALSLSGGVAPGTVLVPGSPFWLESWSPAAVVQGSEVSGGRSLVSAFLQVAERGGTAPALVVGDSEMSYQELDTRSSKVAAALVKRGAGPGKIVGLMMGRTADLIVGMLGILKSGAAYLPLDTTQPASRLEFILKDADPLLVLCDREQTIPVGHESAFQDMLEAEDLAWRASDLPAASDLAYVIYTSGTTGFPKGVAVEHGNVLRLFAAADHLFDFGAEDRWALFHSIAFDFSVWEIWGALLYGGRLVLVSEAERRDPDAFWELLIQKGISVLNQTPSAFRQLSHSRAVQAHKGPMPLRWVIFGGEALESNALKTWSDRFGLTEPALVNMYGITETTVHVTWHQVESADLSLDAIPIGKALPDLQLILVDEAGQPVPAGVQGEICISGPGLARGYLNRPDLTGERFCELPATGSGLRWYRSGDLARVGPDGRLVFSGRLDQQLQIRGYRVEPQEIAIQLQEMPGVASALVLGMHNTFGDAWLCAFVEWPGVKPAPGTEDFRHFLASRIPGYMMPGAFVALDQFPLTANGKPDLVALEAMPVQAGDEGDYVAPETEEEQRMVKIWEQALDRERIGVSDNFFALGGDSILSLRVLSLAGAQGLEFDLADLFRYQTIRKLLVSRQGVDQLEIIVPFSLISAEDKAALPPGLEDAYPVTSMQAAMLFHIQFDPETPRYFDFGSFKLRAPFDESLMRAVLRILTDRHPLLRTAFDLGTYSVPLQLVYQEVDLPFEVTDLRQISQAERTKLLDDFKLEALRKRFNWEVAPLFSLHIHLLETDCFQWSLSNNHAILDGWSVSAFQAEFFSLYLELYADMQSVDGADRSAWMDSRIQEEAEQGLSDHANFNVYVQLEALAKDNEASRLFWQAELEDAVQSVPLRIPARYIEADPARAQEYYRSVPDALGDGIRSLADQLEVPVKTILLASHIRVMALLTGREEVLTGLISNGRPEVDDGDRMLGLFLNTLPVHLFFSGGSWLNLIREVFRKESAMYPHRRFPLVEMGGENREVGLETAFNFIHFHLYRGMEDQTGIEVLSGRSLQQTNLVLVTHFSQMPDTGSLEIILDYRKDWFTEQQLATFSELYIRTLEAMVADPMAPARKVSLLNPELSTQIHAFSRGKVADPSFSFFIPEFEKTAAKCMDQIALREGDRSLTFRETNALANQLGHLLRTKYQAGPGSLIGVLHERSVWLPVCLLGILKSGAAYIPIDSKYPEKRIQLMLEDSKPLMLLLGEDMDRFTAFIPSGTHPVTSRALLQEAEAYPDENLSFVNFSGDPAYCLYTSGSTGMPKGVVLNHGNLRHFLRWAKEEYADTGFEVMLAGTSYCFDLSIYEMFYTLVDGRCVRMMNEPGDLLKWLKGPEMVMLNTVPSLMRELLPEISDSRFIAGVNLGGEVLPPSLGEDLFAAGVTEIRNLYGPTETTTYATCHRLRRGDDPVPVGTPNGHTRLKILDQEMNPVPVGVPGEIFMGGPGIASGYLNRPELTAKRFFEMDQERFYETGDLGYWLPDGAVHFVGRTDFQLKIRGFRIETGEVERVLSGMPGIRNAVVAGWEFYAGEPELAAWLECDPELELTAVRSALREVLPVYMIPSRFFLVQRFPLNANGKVDRLVLMEQQQFERERAQTYVPPGNALEAGIIRLWEAILGVSGIGLHDDFFGLGGHSLKAMQLIWRLADSHGVQISLPDFFDQPTPLALSNMITAASKTLLPPIEPLPAAEDYPLSYPQQRLWILDQMVKNLIAYNISEAFELKGKLDTSAFLRAFASLVARHESLRTRFRVRDGEGRQLVDPVHQRKDKLLNMSEDQALQFFSETAVLPFDFEQGPLYRHFLIRVAPDRYQFHFHIHHIITDAWSLTVLVRELMMLYEALVEGKSDPLSVNHLQYRDFAVWQRRLWGGEQGELSPAARFWKSLLAAPRPVIPLPSDFPRPPAKTYHGKTHNFLIGADEASALKQYALDSKGSLFMVLLTLYKVFLYRLTGEEDLIVGTPVAGRDHPELEQLTGNFLNNLCLRNRIQGQKSFRSLLAEIQQTTLEAFSYREYPFDKLVEILGEERDPSRSFLFDVMIVVQNVDPASLRFGGVQISHIPSHFTVSMYDLIFTFTETGDKIDTLIRYNLDLFKEERILLMQEKFQDLLRHILESPDLPVDELSFRSAAEKEVSDGFTTSAFNF